MANSVLLVEDDNSLRDSLEIILTDAGLNITSTGDGRDALRLLQQEKFDAMVLDDHIPFIQGSDLLNLIRMSNPDVKIIIMSGLFDANGIKKAKDRGADLVIEKPFDFNEIVKYLKEI